MPQSTEFDAQDLECLAARGIEVDEATRQLELLRHPPPAIALDRPCRPGDGILQLRPDEHDDLLQRFAEAAQRGRFSRFVPASGAASRMFDQLLKWLVAAQPAEAQDGTVQDADLVQAAEAFFKQLHQFAFVGALRQAVSERGVDFDEAVRQRRSVVVEALLETPGLDFNALPKALIPFHRHLDDAATPDGLTAFEEQLLEAAEVLAEADAQRRVHFTVPTQHLALCRETLDDLAKRLGQELGGFDVSCSVQQPMTDTLALDAENRPMRDDDGKLLFRPGGHGALLANLRLWATAPGVDLVFVKNIDNIQPASRRSVPVLWKQLLGGVLLRLEEGITRSLAACGAAQSSAAEAERPLDKTLNETLDFAVEQLAAERPAEWAQWNAGRQREHLLDVLQRPLRVCGVVLNQGEPGGGPFWVRDADGHCSPQIVETSQIDRDDPAQQAILEAASHFNPVDMVCRLRSDEGEVFDLPAFVDPSTVFIAQKTHQGRELRALERPGLWNGAMARWNTVFVEVPPQTFAPVKTVFDLLRPEHRA